MGGCGLVEGVGRGNENHANMLYRNFLIYEVNCCNE